MNSSDTNLTGAAFDVANFDVTLRMGAAARLAIGCTTSVVRCGG